MAQQNPEQTEHEPEAWTATTRAEGGINPENQSQETFSHHRPTGAAVRSSPIAIIRTPEGQSDDSSSEEDGDSTIEADMDGLKISGNDRASSRSLPNHLLRAPRLGSMPSDNIDYWIDRHPTMLPPAAKSGESTSRPSSKGGPSLLSGGDDRHTSYGSLRESHMRGKFLDGPSSYRDKTTGDIRSLQHRVRFQEGSVASSLPPSLSIGERIMKSRKQQVASKEGGSSSSKDKGSLTALLEAADTEPELNTAEELPVKARTPTFYEEEEEYRLPSDMLSTSLTGLEILQAGLRVGPATGDQDVSSASQTETHSPLLFGNTEALPLDARGHNALLTRSTSDPLPQGHPRVPVTAASPLVLGVHSSNASTPNRSNRTTNANNSQSSNVPPPLSLDLSPLPTAAAAAAAATNAPPPLFQSAAITGAAPGTTYQMQVHDRRVEGELDAAAAPTNVNANPSDHDPDTDFAFDLELE